MSKPNSTIRIEMSRQQACRPPVEFSKSWMDENFFTLQPFEDEALDDESYDEHWPTPEQIAQCQRQRQYTAPPPSPAPCPRPAACPLNRQAATQGARSRPPPPQMRYDPIVGRQVDYNLPIGEEIDARFCPQFPESLPANILNASRSTPPYRGPYQYLVSSDPSMEAVRIDRHLPLGRKKPLPPPPRSASADRRPRPPPQYRGPCPPPQYRGPCPPPQARRPYPPPQARGPCPPQRGRFSTAGYDEFAIHLRNEDTLSSTLHDDLRIPNTPPRPNANLSMEYDAFANNIMSDPARLCSSLYEDLRI